MKRITHIKIHAEIEDEDKVFGRYILDIKTTQGIEDKDITSLFIHHSAAIGRGAMLDRKERMEIGASTEDDK